MDFQSTNPLNVQLNILSGNLLPTIENSSFSIIWKLYSAIVWSLELVHIVTLILGLFSPIEKSLSDGVTLVITLVIFVEAAFIVIRIQTQRTLIHQLIQKLNEALNIEDENLVNIVMENIKPMEKPFKFYLVSGTISLGFWFSISFLLIFKQDTFYYKDFRTPAVYSKQPFSVGIFILGNTISLITNIYLFLKKISVDVYTTHLVLLITSQYQYIASRLALLFRNRQGNNSFPENNCEDFNIEQNIKGLCQHHNNVMNVTFMLKKLLSFNIFLIYMNNIFRFCFIGLMLTKMATLVEGSMVVSYGFGSLVQFYILCSCFHKLSEATAEITDKAFDEDWNRFSLSIKRSFLLMMMASNNIDMRLSLFEQFNLSLPSFMEIINKAYSIALLVLRFS